MLGNLVCHQARLFSLWISLNVFILSSLSDYATLTQYQQFRRNSKKINYDPIVLSMLYQLQQPLSSECNNDLPFLFEAHDGEPDISGLIALQAVFYLSVYRVKNKLQGT